MSIDLPVTLTVRGTTIVVGDRMRTLHNETAGSPQGIAAARALGDLSHKVFAPLGGDAKSDELLFIDVWVEAGGIQKFFSHPDVQAQGAQLFAHKDPSVWMPARGAYTFSLPAPRERAERYVGLLRGPIASPEDAIALFAANDRKIISEGRKRGQLSHELFIKLGPPGAPLELLGIDVWCDRAGMDAHYAEIGSHMAELAKAFTGAPSASTWQQAEGQWSEW
jgi:quinol monooxygenase YgiN